LIVNGPGATTSLTFNTADNRLYAGVGYGANRGKIYSFGLDKLDSAFLNNSPLDFTADGVLFNPTAWKNQSGAGMFFDAHGYLFSGGNEGITCFAPDGAVSSVLDMGNYTSLIYNPFNDQILAITDYAGTIGTIYNAVDLELVPEPGVLILLGMAAIGFGVWKVRRKS
jgi:hypothetical protein